MASAKRVQELKRLVERGEYNPSSTEIATGILNALSVDRQGRVESFDLGRIGSGMMAVADAENRKRIVAPVAVQLPGMHGGEPVWVLDDGSDDAAFYAEFWTDWNRTAARNHRQTVSWKQQMTRLNAAIRDEPETDDSNEPDRKRSPIGAWMLLCVVVLNLLVLAWHFWHAR